MNVNIIVLLIAGIVNFGFLVKILGDLKKMATSFEALKAEIATVKQVATDGLALLAKLQSTISNFPPSQDAETQAAIDQLTKELSDEISPLKTALEMASAPPVSAPPAASTPSGPAQ